MCVYGYKGKAGRKYGSGQKPALTQKALNGGMHPSVFVNKDDPNYRYKYADKFTDRQLKVLNEEIPLEQVRLTDIVAIQRKAEQLEDLEKAEKAEQLYWRKKKPEDKYTPSLSLEEALEFLDTHNSIE